MIGDPVALTIRRKIERPSKALLDRFRGAQTSFVADAQNGGGVLDQAIKPISPAMAFIGVAVTASGGPRDLLAVMALLDFVEPGDVIMVATGNDVSAAVIGDHYAAIAKQKGVAAIVTDGLLRDAIGIEKVGIPSFSRGLSPNSGFQNGPGEINLPVSIGGLSVEPGDIVIGDRDGVIVVPRARAEQVAESLDRVRKLEHEAELKVAAGQLKQLWKPEKFEARGVRYLD